jgi:hypothetical protein
MKRTSIQVIFLVLVALALASVTAPSKDRPAVEMAYTQDGCNCVRGHVRDQDNKPIPGARVSLMIEKTSVPVGFVETDPKGDFIFRSVRLNEELMLMVEADGFTQATVPGIKVRPSYSFVAHLEIP